MWVKDFVIYLDAICNMFTLISSGPVAFPTDIDDISFWTYSSVISGNVHFPSSELIRVKWILSSTEPRGVALLTKRSPTVEKCSLNISAMSARSSTTSPCWERRELGTIFCLLGRTSFSFFHITDELPLFSSMVDIKCSLFLQRICSITEFRSCLYTSQLFCEPEHFEILCARSRCRISWIISPSSQGMITCTVTCCNYSASNPNYYTSFGPISTIVSILMVLLFVEFCKLSWWINVLSKPVAFH